VGFRPKILQKPLVETLRLDAIKQEKLEYMTGKLCKTKLARDAIRYWRASSILSRDNLRKNRISKDFALQAMFTLDNLISSRNLKLKTLSLKKLKELHDEQERSNGVS
jgi:hypothetical protein